MLWHRRYPWQPCKWPPHGTVTMNHSVEYLSSNTNLIISILTEDEGRNGQKIAKKHGQQAKLLVRLEASLEAKQLHL